MNLFIHWIETTHIFNDNAEYGFDVMRTQEIVLYYNHNLFMGAGSCNFIYEVDRPDQNGVSGRIILTETDYEYETAVEFWEYETTTEYTFSGVIANGNIYVTVKDIREVSRRSNGMCVRNHQEEIEAAFEARNAA